ncbi:MAG: hypothetical protein M1829_003007 [Trizodia sp. TS-e1964]|nr:MAG: hypothetical protein M1829_003007 [Trizodia sp. TS-e1964]
MKNGILNLVVLCISAGQVIAAPLTSNAAVEVLHTLNKRSGYVAKCPSIAQSIDCNENGSYMICNNYTLLTNDHLHCGNPQCYCYYFETCTSHCNKEQEEQEAKLVAGQASAKAAQADKIE